MKFGPVSASTFRHSNCLQNNCDDMFWCGPFEICLDCLNCSIVREQTKIFEKTKTVLKKMENCETSSAVQGITAKSLLLLTEEEKDDSAIPFKVFFNFS